MSIDIEEKFVIGSPGTRSGDPWFGSLPIYYNRAHRFVRRVSKTDKKVQLRGVKTEVKALYKDVDRIYIYIKIQATI